MSSSRLRIAIAGGGPTGLFLSIALARRGHRVLVVDRDPGPAGASRWDRRGVMQFHHPHGFRMQVCDAVQAEMPDVWEDLLAEGAEPVYVDPIPGRAVGLRCRRMTFERILRAAAEAEPGVDLQVGHVDDVVATGRRATGLRVDGRIVDADVVLDASGRARRLSRRFQRPTAGGDCGISYVSRQYQLRDRSNPGPMNAPIGMAVSYPGYITIVFLHDSGTFSALVVRASSDHSLEGLRTPGGFEAAARAVPMLAEWTDPARSGPITSVLPGGHLHNTYSGQLAESGEVPLVGLIFVGDVVCTTNPSAGRGVALSFLQARQLLDLMQSHGSDFESCSRDFDSSCERTIRPWFEDHVDVDEQLLRRWAGLDVDMDRKLPSDLVMAAAEVDASMMRVVGPYQAMMALPASLAEVEPGARRIFASGWRPSVPEGPTREELADLVGRAALAGTLTE